MAGLIVLGTDLAKISMTWMDNGDNCNLSYSIVKNADKGSNCCSVNEEPIKITGSVYLRVIVTKGAICSFSYSMDGITFKPFKEKFIAKPGKWVGAKLGLFHVGVEKTNDSGWADIDWFRVEELR